ncbi:hypothetical protein OHC33_005132 [Knufia fluminis]|uniref:Uncharacterized protein n=1 Tax=Knufia fluminis TaxID=191047 RepID=A0AAN8ELX7_9EURO|nr:hypothetical protein OHC33_005132 [Knufia fluminis]
MFLRTSIFIVVLSYCLTTATADELNPSQTPTHVRLLYPRHNVTGPNPNDYECISERASDYYGIGVRLGLYFSWCTSWLANTGMPDEVTGALDQNAVFLFATIVALVRCTITFVLTQLDCLIMMHLGMGTVLSVLSTWGYRTCHYQQEGPQAIKHYGGIGTHLRLALSGAISAFSVWFWHKGVMPGDADLINDVGPCATVYTFMFAKLNAAGPIRIFYIIVSVFWTVYFCIMILVSPLAGVVRFQRIVALTRAQRFRTSHRLHIATGLNYRQLRYVFNFLRALNFFWIVFSMITVEFSLNYNHVVSVLGPQGRIYFPSQLIPMIIGAFTLTRILYKKLEKLRGGDDVEPTVVREATVEGPPQEMPSRRNIFKLFAPPTSHVQPRSKYVPEDEDIDPKMDGKSAWIRYLVVYLPWLSLLFSSQNKSGSHSVEGGHLSADSGDVEGRAQSAQDTLPGSPASTANKEKYGSWHSEGIDRDAVPRSWSRSRISTGGLMNKKQRKTQS